MAFGTQKLWTDEDKATLAAMVKEGFTDKRIAQALGRTARAVQAYRNRFGIRRLGWSWTKREDLVLRENADLKAAEVALMLPRRSVVAVRRRRLKLGLRAQRAWTEKEHEVLRNNLHLTDAELGKLVNRTIHAVSARKSLLGLKKDRKRAG